MQWFYHSESGNNHENEDVVLAKVHPCDEHLLICLLADGQGGQPGGKEAAQIALETAWREAIAQSPEKLKDRITWCEIIAAADEAVCEDEMAGFTTLIALCSTPNQIYGAAVGDSMALLVKPQDFINLTIRQRKNPPVGSSAAFPSPFEFDVQSNEKLLIMSYGVWRYMSQDNLAQAARNETGQDLIKTLRLMQTNQNRGNLPDDFSVIMIDF